MKVRLMNQNQILILLVMKAVWQVLNTVDKVFVLAIFYKQKMQLVDKYCIIVVNWEVVKWQF